MPRAHALLLHCAATDRTFRRAQVGRTEALVGKCIHCNTEVSVGLDGRPLSGATLEHIVPRNHGGTSELDNLAVACSRCNAGKGMRLDNRRKDDPKLLEVIATLRARKLARARPPLPGVVLPPLGSSDPR